MPPNVSRGRARVVADSGDYGLTGLSLIEQEADGRAIGPRREDGDASGPGRSEKGA